MKKTYISRVKKCGDFGEIRNYENKKTIHYGTTNYLGAKRICYHFVDDFEVCPRYEGGRTDSVNRARQRIYDIVEGNWSDLSSPLFITFTFRENVQDVEFAICEFRKFLKKLSYDFFGNRWQLRYVATAELQARGAVHFHALMDLPMSNYKERRTRRLARLWGFGFVDIQDARITKKGQAVESLAGYIAKYLGKDNIHTFGKNMFLASRNLYRPDVEFYDVAQNCELAIIKSTVIGFNANGNYKFIKYKKI